MANLFNHFQSALQAFTKEVHDHVKENATCYIEDSGVNKNEFYIHAYRADIEVKIQCSIFFIPVTNMASVSFSVDCPFTGQHKHEWSCMPIELDSESIAASINCYL